MKHLLILSFVGILLVSFGSTSHVAAWKWPDTGQTSCYNNREKIYCPYYNAPFYGQDAQHYGPARSYTKLGHGGVELPDDAAHVDDGGEWIMTRDNVTGLVWEVKTQSNRSEQYDDQDAKDIFIAGLNDANFGSYSDWRMPTIRELSSLVDAGTYSPAIDTAWFPLTVSWTYRATASLTHAVVNFDTGFVDGSKSSSLLHVRAVRAGQTEPSNHLVDNGDGTVSDRNTGLMWQKETAPQVYTWEEALDYVVRLNMQTLAGHSDWRLPNRNELQSLVDYFRYYPSIDPLLSATTVPSEYWSSTSCVFSAYDAWPVSFHFGDIIFSRKSMLDAYVRAVRTYRYTVLFQDHNGRVLKREMVDSGGSATAPADPVREGYTFSGWDGAFQNVTRNLTVTARYTANMYTVTLNAQGGTPPEPATLQVGYGTRYGSLPGTTWEGHTFAGWYTEAVGGAKVTESTLVATASDHTLYAHWNPIHTLAYTAGAHGSLLGETLQTVEHGGSGTSVTAVPAAGYRFVRWSDGDKDNPRTDDLVEKDLSVTAIFHMPGDVNADDTVDLADAILAFQVVCEAPSPDPPSGLADLDGDGRIGLAEAIHILQSLL